MTKYELLVIGVEVVVLIGVWVNTTINLVKLRKPPQE